MSDRAVIIYYNDEDVFSGISPTPFVTRSNSVINYGKRHGQLGSITLDGTITGTDSFESSYDKSLQLLSGFSDNFRTLKIVNDTGTQETIFENVAKINSINFQESRFHNLVDYSINLEVYEQEHFSENNFGVIDPVDNVALSRSENGDVSISRTVSAKGFHTGHSDALQNAIDFVSNRTGLKFMDALSIPFFVSGSGNGNNLILKSQSEDIDRFNATYSVTEDYAYQELSGAGADSDLYGSSLECPIYKTCTFNYSPPSQDSPRKEASFNIEFKTSQKNGHFPALRSGVAQYVNKLKANPDLSAMDDDLMIKESYKNFGLTGGALYFELSENENEKTINLTVNVTDDTNFISEYGVYYRENYSVSHDPIRDFADVSFSFDITPFGLISEKSQTYNHVSNASSLQKRSYSYYYDKILSGSYGSNALSGYVMEKAKVIFTGILGSDTRNNIFKDKFKIASIEKSDTTKDAVISVSANLSNNESLFSGNLTNGNYNIEVSPSQKILKFSNSALQAGHCVATVFDNTFTRQVATASLDAFSDPKKLQEWNNNVVTETRQAKEFCESMVDKVQGANSQTESHTETLNKFNGDVSCNISESSEASSTKYRLENPYIGLVNP